MSEIDNSKSPALPVELLVEKRVRERLKTMRNDRHALKQLMRPDDLQKMTDELYLKLSGEMEEEVSYLQDAIYIEIKREIREGLESETVTQERITYFTEFLDNDVDKVICEATEKCVEEKLRTMHEIEPIAQEARITIAQLLLNAKKEFTAEAKQAVRQPVLAKIAELDQCYSEDRVIEKIATKVGITYVAHISLKLRRQLMETIAQGKTTSSDADQFIKAAATLLTVSQKEVNSQFQNEEIRELVHQDLQKLADQFASKEAVLAKFFPA